jgi:hypothetical protein
MVCWETPLNINLNVKNENQDCKVGTVCGGILVGGEGEWKRWYMVDGLHIPIWNRTKKPLAIALSEVGKGLRRGDNRGNVNNV